jgi:2-polyprenyl-3-methyl-5-hydroxy-6-metoxy-1,4-benzoquinol methylase
MDISKKNFLRIKKLKIKKRNCPVCDSKKFINFYKNEKYSKIDARGNIFEYKHILVRCKYCNLIYSNPWLGYDNTNLIYKYSAIGSALEVSKKSERHFNCFKSFFTKKCFKKRNIKILEIGTATGSLLKNIHNHYNLKKKNLFGIEPSRKLYQNLKENRYFEIENKFIHELSSIEKFDLIIIDNVFEHIEKPTEALEIIKSLMKVNSKIYVSVPNLFKLKKNFRDPFGHSINYYENNIKFIFNSCNLKIVKLKKQYRYLNFVAMKDVKKKLFKYNFKNDYKTKFKKLKKFTHDSSLYKNKIIKKFKKLEKEIKVNNLKVILFGASNFALEFLRHTNIFENIIFLADSNKIYHNKMRFGIKVISPKKLKSLKFDKIIITSDAFLHDIKKNLFSLNISREKIISI